MKILLFFSMTFLVGRASLAAVGCVSNERLLSTGWVQHSSLEFDQTLRRLLETVFYEKLSFKEDLVIRFPSPYLGKMINLRSWDDLRTSDLEMFGDIIFYFESASGNFIEIRWYENMQKHFIVSQDQCSCDDAPLAENALF